MLAPWAEVLYACDLRWWAKRRPQGSQSPALWVSMDRTAADRYGTLYVPAHNHAGLCRTPWEVHQGLNSGFQALNLAYHFGVDRVLLLGFDMKKADNGKTHFFGDYPAHTGLQVPSPYPEFVKRFGSLARDLAAEGVQVVNCSPDTALECFQHGSIFEEL